MKKILVLAAMVGVFMMAVSSFTFGSVMISQYYEGPSTNKWIEITNVGASDVQLSDFKISIFSNGARENWKTGGAANATVTLSNFVLASGSSYILGNTANTTPAYASANQNANTVINFNGDDSVVLWTGAAFAFSGVVDAFGLTGNTAQDKSFVRKANVLVGTNADFNASDWTEVSLADVNNAAVGTTERIGFHSFNAVPEPTALLLVGSIIGAGLLRRRRA